jgi:hypothetical protein
MPILLAFKLKGELLPEERKLVVNPRMNCTSRFAEASAVKVHISVHSLWHRAAI